MSKQTIISVIVCTHNPRPDYFRRVLDALRAQITPLAQWELLIVDNASKEQLADIWDISWHPRGRHVREDALGLTPARLRGIHESCGEYLVFVDDDNLLAPDFLEQVLAIFVRHPDLGVIGAGVLEPEFEAPPAPELLPYLNLLALRTVPSPRWSNNAKDAECIPWGAGLCVTRRVADYYPRLLDRLKVAPLLGRRGDRLFCGEDNLFSWAAVGAGHGFGLFPELRLIHLISSWRLNQRYFLRLIHDHTFSNGILRYLLAGVEQRRIGLVRCLHLLLIGSKAGRFEMQFEWAISRGEDCAARFVTENRLRSIELAPVSFSENRHPELKPLAGQRPVSQR